MAQPKELTRVENLDTFWAELKFNARFGMVEHLDDLMLRRTRLGMLLPNGGMDVMEKVRELTQSELHWTEEEWQQEITRYQQIYREAYSPNPESYLNEVK